MNLENCHAVQRKCQWKKCKTWRSVCSVRRWPVMQKSKENKLPKSSLPIQTFSPLGRFLFSRFGWCYAFLHLSCLQIEDRLNHFKWCFIACCRLLGQTSRDLNPSWDTDGQKTEHKNGVWVSSSHGFDTLNFWIYV